MDAVCRAIDRLSTAVGILAAWLLAPLVIALCYEVVARYVFGAPTIWAYELAYLLTGSGWMLGMAYALAKGAHIRIDVLYLNLSPRKRALVDVIGYCCLLLPFLIWVATMLDDRAIHAFRSGEKTGQSAWNPPLWPFRTVFFVSFAMLALQAAAEAVRAILVLVGRAPGAR
ncbi:TRAP-type mannitol/chloroaromatic compound transport system permease small subunit [Stella humosa]|uniref:TRAP transporter small permease protein n=1 Tax=Stella humosa TaxID=94 RepID=A0A3N1KSA3_9PROT|nr:TRAP transporter small permease subunit [Stella humosa]ROP83461.1 TRAP-type mannitol/chloroaromatic compound transport system permease small subunit [Stella humosa]BBK33267.1 transporter DctQ-related protein [Stella humosa]